MRVERASFVSTSGELRDRFEILLGDVVYVKSIDDARRLADWIYELLDEESKLTRADALADAVEPMLKRIMLLQKQGPLGAHPKWTQDVVDALAAYREET